MSTLRFLNWNIAWRSTKGRAGKIIKDIIKDYDADVICLTETYDDFFDSGFVASSHPDYGYLCAEGRRKVILWAKTPWTDVDNIGAHAMPSGRFINATTHIEHKAIQITGVCIPWKQAHVTTGQKNKKPWQDHMKYLDGLEEHIRATNYKNSIVAGDFNQAIPRTRQPTYVYDRLLSSIKGLSIPEYGPSFLDYNPMIDHTLTTPDILIKQMEIIPANFKDEVLSDHNGVYSELVITD